MCFIVNMIESSHVAATSEGQEPRHGTNIDG